MTNAAEIRRLERVKRAVRRLLQSLSRLPARPSGLRLRVERVTGIEPAWPAWKAGALPLSYTRETVGGNAPLAPTSPADQDPRVAVRVERSAWPIRRAAQARRGWSEVARRVPKSGLCGADPCTDEHPAAGQRQVRNRRWRRIRVSTSSVYNSAAHGLTGGGVTNDQPALVSLVDRLGHEYAEAGRPGVIVVPPEEDSNQDAATVWRSGLADRRRHAGALPAREPRRSHAPDLADVVHHRPARRRTGQPPGRLHLGLLPGRWLRDATGRVRPGGQGSGPA